MHFSKVEICGVNTSQLPILDNNEKVELMNRIKQGDKEAKEKFINGNLRLVLSVIQRFSGRGENPDDLFQVGCIGLIKAINNFNTELDVKFSTYAVPMIIGELRRYLRDNNSVHVSRSLRDLAYKALTERERLQKLNCCEPTIEQVARNIGEQRESVVMALDAITDPVSLYEPVYSEGGDALYVMDQLCDKHQNDSNWVEEIALKQAMHSLSDREKDILTKRFFEGKTQIEVANEIGISQAQVSRLEKCAMARIKKQL